MATRKLEAMARGAPLFVSQFGHCSNSIECIQEINSLLDACETSLCNGWTLMNFGQLNQEGKSLSDKARALMRPFVKAVQGKLTLSKFDRYTNIFQASWVADT